VVGGGPTGVELAGALAEFLRYTLPRDFPEVPAGTVTLLEAGPRLLSAFRPALGRYAEGALAQLGVRVRLGAQVAEVGEGWVRLSGGERLKGDLVLWAVGVRGNPLPGLPADARGRVPTDPCLRLVGYPEVYVVGDLNGLGFPQLAPVALQQGRWAARNLLRALRAGVKGAGPPPLPLPRPGAACGYRPQSGGGGALGPRGGRASRLAPLGFRAPEGARGLPQPPSGLPGLGLHLSFPGTRGADPPRLNL